MNKGAAGGTVHTALFLSLAIPVFAAGIYSSSHCTNQHRSVWRPHDHCRFTERSFVLAFKSVHLVHKSLAAKELRKLCRAYFWQAISWPLLLPPAHPPQRSQFSNVTAVTGVVVSAGCKGPAQAGP